MSFPLLNIARYRETVFEIIALYDWNDDRRKIFSDLFLVDDDADTAPAFLNTKIYTSRDGTKTPHTVTITAWHTNESQPTLFVSIEYSTVPAEIEERRLLPSLARRRVNFSQRLGEAGEARKIYYSTRFRFEADAVVDLWFPLPTPIAERTGIVEIRGVRGTRFGPSADEPEYDFTLDRPLNSDVYLAVRSESKGLVGKQTPIQALRRASAIASTLVNSREGAESDARNSDG